MIRLAKNGDLARITDIFNQAIGSKRAVADIKPFTPAQKELWFTEQSMNERTPIYVYEENRSVVGYCYLSAYRPGRQALESIAEISYFIDTNHHRRGIGGRLVEHTIVKAKELGYRNLLAIVLSCNERSFALLEKYGFKLWGALPNILYLDENVYSHFYYGLNIKDTND